MGCEGPDSATNSAMERVKSLIKMAAGNLTLLAIMVLFIAFLNLIVYMWDIFCRLAHCFWLTGMTVIRREHPHAHEYRPAGSITIELGYNNDFQCSFAHIPE